VANGSNRFTNDARLAAGSSRYRIILTGQGNLITELRRYQQLQQALATTNALELRVRLEVQEQRIETQAQRIVAQAQIIEAIKLQSTNNFWVSFTCFFVFCSFICIVFLSRA